MTQSTRWRIGLVAAGLLFPLATMGQGVIRVDEGETAKKTDKKEKSPPPTPPKVGDTAPVFELKSTDGKTYQLGDYKDKIVVLEWLNQDCPFSNFVTGAGAKAKALADKYAKKGVVWLAIDSTHYQTGEKDAAYAKEHKIPYPILMDPEGKVGRLYGAATTPHMFVIQKGNLAYIGAFDNDPRKRRPEKEYRGYVDEALTALLAGEEVPLTSTKSWGCPVKYKPVKKNEK